MSSAGAYSFSCAQPDLGSSPCISPQLTATRSFSAPLRHPRPFSRPGQLCRCASLGPNARQPIVSASAVADAEPRQRGATSGSTQTEDYRRLRLEASYQAECAAQLKADADKASSSDGFSDLDEDHVQLERSWQAQPEPSVSGRKSASKTVKAPASRARRKIVRSQPSGRSGRLRGSLRRSHSQSTGTLSSSEGHSSSAKVGHSSSAKVGHSSRAKVRHHMDPDRQYIEALKLRLEPGGVAMSRKLGLLRTTGDPTLLSREEEQRLSQIIQKGLSLQRATAEQNADSDNSDDPDEQSQADLNALRLDSAAAARHQIKINMADARDVMVKYNVRLVMSQARTYLGRGVEFDDLIQEGLNGVVIAIDKFDASRGFKFSTYAHWWIKQSLSRCIASQSRVVRLPVHVYEANSKILKAKDLLRSKGFENPTDEQVGAVAGIKPCKVQMFLNQMMLPAALDGPAYASGSSKQVDRGITLAETAVEQVSETEEDTKDELKLQQDAQAMNDLNALLMTLLPRERNVLRMRYGLHDKKGTCMTFNDIGAAYGLSNERVRQIEDKALTKLKDPGRRKVLQRH